MSEDTEAEKRTEDNGNKADGYGEDRSNGMLADESENGCPMNR